jgi:hypothetical protein
MRPAFPQSESNHDPLATNLQTLGRLVRYRRVSSELTLVDAADLLNVDADVLSRIEDGQSVDTEALFKVLTGLGLVMLVMPKSDANIALRAIGHAAHWHRGTAGQSPTSKAASKPAFELDNAAPTLFVDFDGTLHPGDALIDENGHITLDSGSPLLEFAPLLVEMLEPYPTVEIVLTTSWLQKLPVDKVISYLPPELARRVVGTTRDIKPRLSDVLNGTERTYVISSYAYGRRLKNWLAIDDAVHGAYQFGSVPGQLVEHFLLLDSGRGISEVNAQQRIRAWLVELHTDRNA